MVNLSQVLNIVGTAGSRACEGIEQPLRVQEVYGVFNWDGVYIDYESFEKVSLFLQNRKNLRFDMQPITELRKVDNPVLQRRFTDVESSRYIILITPLLNPNMVLLRRSDCAVNMDQVRGDPGAWDESVSATHTSFEPAEDATKECDSMGLHDLGKTIRRLAEQSRDLDWKKVATVELNRDWDGDSVTSIDTSPSFLANEAAEIAGRDDLRFRFRRRSIPSQSVHSGATTTNQEVQHSRPRHRPSRNSHTKNKALADFTADEPADRKRLRIEASKVEMDRPAKRAETQAPDIVSWLDGVQSPGKPRASK